MKNEYFITEFCKIIDQAHGKRPDKFWFATWMASKSPYVDFSKSFENFWKTKKLPTTITSFEKILLTIRICKTFISLLIKSTFLKTAMRNELQALNKLRGQKIIILRTFSYSYSHKSTDPFWGELVDELSCSATPLLIIYDPNFSILKCKAAFNPQKNNFPLFIFLSPWKLFTNFYTLVKEGFSQQELTSYLFENIETKDYLSSAYKREILSPSTYVNFAYFNCFEKILSNFDIDKAYLPFENNPWEKMFHIAKTQLKKDFKTIGFQHAALQRDATNYFLSSYEISHKLHPEIIITNGEITFNYLKSIPHYDNINLLIGCALRHKDTNSQNVSIRRESNGPTRFLVLLDGVLDTRYLLDFISKFSKNLFSKNLEIVIREHPSLPIKRILSKKDYMSLLNNKSLKISRNILDDDLRETDIVLYSGSTTSIEALSRGKAVISYNYRLFNYDPLFSFSDFKWLIQTEDDLISAINNYRSLSAAEIIERQRISQLYVQKYFLSCTCTSINKFLNL